MAKFDVLFIFVIKADLLIRFINPPVLNFFKNAMTFDLWWSSHILSDRMVAQLLQQSHSSLVRQWSWCGGLKVCSSLPILELPYPDFVRFSIHPFKVLYAAGYNLLSK